LKNPISIRLVGLERELIGIPQDKCSNLEGLKL